MVRIVKDTELKVQQALNIPIQLRRNMIDLVERSFYPSLNALMIEAIENLIRKHKLIKANPKPKKGE